MSIEQQVWRLKGADEALLRERQRQIRYFKKLCWSMYDIWLALTWGVDDRYECEDIQDLIEKTI